MDTGEVLVTTADTVHGRRIVRYLGIVFGEHVHAPGWLRGIAEDVRHALDDRREEIDTDLLHGRAAALRELRRHARELRANAVIAVHFQVQPMRGGVVATLAHGTAVLLDDATPGGWISAPEDDGPHPVVAALREDGPASLAELSIRMAVDIDWLDATLQTLEDAGQVEMDDDGTWSESP